MKKIALMVVLLAFTFGSSVSKAGILLEPYAGYHIGSFDVKSMSGMSTASNKLNGLGFGLRAGMKFFPLFIAADVHYAMSSINDGTTSVSAPRLAVGAVVGGSLLVIRVWGGAYVLNQVSSLYGGADRTYKGIAFKFGLGYEVLPFLSINAEYLLSPFSSVSTGGVSTDIPDASSITGNSLFFSISAPLGI